MAVRQLSISTVSLVVIITAFALSPQRSTKASNWKGRGITTRITGKIKRSEVRTQLYFFHVDAIVSFF